MFLDVATNDPHRLALVDDLGTVQTFGALHERATRLGRAMRAAGVPVGGHVGVLTENRAEFFELYLAAILSGIWLVPINGLLSPTEVGSVVADADLIIVFAEDELAHLVPARPAGRSIRQRVRGDGRGWQPFALPRRQPARISVLLHLGNHRQPEGGQAGDSGNGVGDAARPVQGRCRRFARRRRRSPGHRTRLPRSGRRGLRSSTCATARRFGSCAASMRLARWR